MIIEEKLMIDGLEYRLVFKHYYFQFYLNNPPKKRVQINYKKNPHLALFRDEPLYEDLNLNLPALQIFNAIRQRLEQLIYEYQISYWTFSATSVKKANIYEKLLQRWLKRHAFKFRYERHHLDFYIYLEQDFCAKKP